MVTVDYRFKDEIKMSLEHFNAGRRVMEGGIYAFESKLLELDRVYAQAQKADEYEKSKHRTHVNDCKAEAFDAILKAYDEALSEGHLADDVCNIVEKYNKQEELE